MEGNDEKRFRWIFDNIQDVYYEASLEGVLLEASPSVALLSKGQYTREEVLGKNLVELYGRAGERDEFYSAIMKSGSVTDYELDIRNKDGSVIPCAISSKLVFDEAGKPEKICGTIRDISERKQAELLLLRQSAELYQANATKDKFFSIIAHDLKSPFNSILGFSSLLADEIDEMDKEETARYAGMIHNAATKAFELLENLLLWARSQRGLVDFAPEKMKLRPAVDEVIALARLQAEKKEISLESAVADDITVFADPQMVKTIIRNLVSNAIKFTPGGGKVSVDVKRGTCDEVRETNEVAAETLDTIGESLHATRDTSHLPRIEITVKDSGVGIPANRLEEIFRVDSKSSTPGTANESGSGLGLILCREFAERNGGSISVESAVGEGSTFRVVLREA